jgi:hypothetical protein
MNFSHRARFGFAMAGALAAMLATAAAADPAPPKLAPAPKETGYTVTLSPRDLQAIGFAVQHIGEKCSVQAEDYCQAQLALDQTAKALTAQMKAQAVARSEPPPAPSARK